MRTFIAIELPKEIKQELAKMQEQLKASGADVKWVKPENIHLTLKFLGEIEERKLEQINQILQEVTKNKSTFQASISSLGAFPK
ncbi:MAG: RNA 2',3'-cyclic phosphodiesterase, partial [Candidatus Omnitrophica bacterium]|nr:RNA 2',3'-cyclic phosphodiesterase [Candidatus Omnitrophota bacterium]